MVRNKEGKESAYSINTRERRTGATFVIDRLQKCGKLTAQKKTLVAMRKHPPALLSERSTMSNQILPHLQENTK